MEYSIDPVVPESSLSRLMKGAAGAIREEPGADNAMTRRVKAAPDSFLSTLGLTTAAQPTPRSFDVAAACGSDYEY